eukprot:NODE_859_length_3643_cov_0.232223.p2 type:complete len:295 gc:universal NODE_859_length_3643_cov_0.232223:2663-3547(+)
MDINKIEKLCKDDERNAVKKWLRTGKEFPIPNTSFQTSLRIAKYASTFKQIPIENVRRKYPFDLNRFIDDPPRECLVELCGMFSSGKSQILLQMAAKIHCIYIGTEDRFRIERFKRLGGIDVLVKVTYCLMDFICAIEELDLALSLANYRAVIIDSMHKVREPILADYIGRVLNSVAIKHGVSIIFVNQIRSSMELDDNEQFYLSNIQSITPKTMDAFIEHKLFVYRLDVPVKPTGYEIMNHSRVISVVNSRSNPTVLDSRPPFKDDREKISFLKSRCAGVIIAESSVTLSNPL